ncbi:MAG: Crp/Fnr family transcriptional regulator [Geminicoccaceae bacterium]
MDVFRQFSEKEIQFVSKFKSGELVVDAGATIILEENASPHLYTILDGWAFRHKQLLDGRRQILNFALPGDLVGLQMALMDEMEHTVTALTRTTLCVFQRSKIWNVFKEFPDLSFSMTWLAAREEQMIDTHLLSVGQRSSLERAAHLILHLYDRAAHVGYAGDDTMATPFTQTHFSDALGITNVHTSRTIKKLQQSELITWANDRIEIRDRQGLERLAEYEQDVAATRPLI